MTGVKMWLLFLTALPVALVGFLLAMAGLGMVQAGKALWDPSKEVADAFFAYLEGKG